MATMRVVQSLVPTDPSRLLNGRYHSQSPDRYASGCKPVESATAIRSPKRDITREFNTRAYRDMRWPE